MDESAGQLTHILEAVAAGDAAAAEKLLPLVYDELRRLAAAKMANEAPGQTLQPTALVHEAWLRLGGDAQPEWNSRAHFFGAAAEAMRRILVERARRRDALKRGGGVEALSVEELEIPIAAADDDRLLAVNDALEKFASVSPRKAELVKLRYFAGLSFDEAASALSIAVPTAKEWWAYARAWLAVEMRRALGQ
jgi:RNA polymerase sigma factor (TIGR02999 family)